MLLPLLFSFIITINTDFASDHVHQYLNNSVAPCDNFYRHVCSIGMDPNDTVWKKSEKFYKDIATKLKARTLNNPVMNDITEARGDLNCTYNADVYTTMLRERCTKDFNCYFDEFLYFYTLYNKTNESIDDSLTFYSTHGNKTSGRNITQSLKATSKMVELLYKNSNSSKDFNDTTSTYTLLNDRLFVMELLNESDTYDHVGLEKIHNLTKQIKQIVLQTFKETPWMSVINEFGFTILGQYMTILDELIVLTDFDSFDRNLTTLRKINRDITAKYFEYSPRTTGCTWFDVVHSFNTTSIELEKKYTSIEEQINFARAAYSLVYNAFNYVEASIIVVLAPTFYPLIDNSSDTTMIAFAGDILGHEIYHSFITEALLNRSEEYRNEAECLSTHYNQSCTLFAEGRCHSGPKTLSEDGPDLEGIRAAYKLLTSEFTQDELNEFEYPDLEITREQSFFYSVAMRSCRDISKAEYREHSPDNIRVNALVSQIPEFSRAFSCQTDDLLYSEPDGVCFLFGKNATGKKKTTTASIEKDATNGTTVSTRNSATNDLAVYLSEEIARLLDES